MDSSNNATVRRFPGGEKIKRVAGPNTGKHTIVIEPIVGIVQVELAVLGVAVEIHDAAIAVRVQPKCTKSHLRHHPLNTLRVE